ncbi:ParA family protein [Deefgea salmonis]|uniref:ParA family protein n=1 Tax=Deefgea salmonis TaxID=2875502 RepID=A0ABS8BGD2_9NEIS|nr:ParA family protein [Deefgea salmonis]MCB5194771.1 ParA family protein [Deefgea salmonis]
MTVIAVFNMKGGVGKTTIAANLAAAIAKNGIEPLLIDLDPQAHLTSMYGIKIPSSKSIYRFYQGLSTLSDLATPLPSGIQFIASHLELGKIDAQVSRHRDNIWRLKLGLHAEMLAGSGLPIIIDCTPMLGVVAFSALFAADIILVPVAAEYLALNGAMQLSQTLYGLEKFQARTPRRYLINRYIPNQITAETVAGQLTKHFPGEVLKTRIREQEALAAAVGCGSNIFDFAPTSDAATDFSFLLDELIESNLLSLSRDLPFIHE